MSALAILFEQRSRSPRAVRLALDGGELLITFADGECCSVPWWRLFRLEDLGTTHRFGRIDAPGWELRVSSGSDRALLAQIGRRRFATVFARLRHLQSLKVIVGLAMLLVTLLQHLPADWTARLLPEVAERRLVAGVTGQFANRRCNHEGGEAALRNLLIRLDSEIGRNVEVVAFDMDGYLVTSIPARKIVLLRYAMTEFDVDALAGLLAHELSHIRHGDPSAAVLRRYGFLGTWGAVLEGEDRRELELDFSSKEESRADVEAIQMLRHAGIPLRPAAELFEQMRIARAANSGFAADLRDFHFGLFDRARRWRVAAQNDPPRPPNLMSQEERDAIFNNCWPGQILPAQVPASPLQRPLGYPNRVQPGTGGLSAAQAAQSASPGRSNPK